MLFKMDFMGDSMCDRTDLHRSKVNARRSSMPLLIIAPLPNALAWLMAIG